MFELLLWESFLYLYSYNFFYYFGQIFYVFFFFELV